MGVGDATYSRYFNSGRGILVFREMETAAGFFVEVIQGVVQFRTVYVSDPFDQSVQHPAAGTVDWKVLQCVNHGLLFQSA